jgi:NADPH-dependent curcumin reductase CurA
MGALKTYREPLQIGQASLFSSRYRVHSPDIHPSKVMDGMSVSLVIASKSPKFKPGDKVFLMSGWQEFTVFDAESDLGKAVEILPSDVSFEDSHYILGVTALTGGYECDAE